MTAPAWIPCAAMLIALGLDHWFGEPPVRLHPVVAMGQYLGWAGRRLPTLTPRLGFAAGMAAWWAGALVVGVVASMVDTAARHIASPHGLVGNAGLALLLGLALKPMLAWRMLREEVQAVEHALTHSLEAGRTQVARLASRATLTLDATQVRETAIETLAENLNDSVIAPLFWFAVAGLPGAVLYRYANTADAMWGYRGRWEWAGKWAAWTDDVLSWLPARLTALALWPTAWQALRQEARRTPSPNGGWPMGAMALALGIQLSKPGVYRLNATGRAATPGDVAAAVHRARRGLWCGAGGLMVLAGLAGLADGLRG